MQKKAMLSQPMAGKTEAEIIETRERAIERLQSLGYEIVNTLFTDEWYKPEAMQARGVVRLQSLGYEIVNTLFTDEWYKPEAMQARGVVQIPLCFLAKSLENMSLCHVAYFAKGWEQARGCRIEHAAAVAYGLEIIYE